ncbi:MAG TPA: glycerophosphodiester phosphodiesterase family protein [Oscillatoriaceae cyanobacterium]
MQQDSILALRERLGRPLVMGHRGAMGHRPENTMASFQLAREMGADAVECDVHLSKDGHLIVMHDETVDRTTSGHGAIAALTLEEIKRLDAGSKFAPEFAGESVPTLEELLVWAKDKLPVVIELKLGKDAVRIAEACITLVERLGMGAQVAFISFDHFVPREIKKRQPHWQVGILYVGRLVDPVGAAGAALANGMLPQWQFLTPDLVEAAHRERLWVGVWSPNTEPELRYAIANGADMIGTNYPDRLVAILEGMRTSAG